VNGDARERLIEACNAAAPARSGYAYVPQHEKAPAVAGALVASGLMAVPVVVTSVLVGLGGFIHDGSLGGEHHPSY
jgi:hypothetical protein